MTDIANTVFPHAMMIDNSSKLLLRDALRKTDTIPILGDLGAPKIDVVAAVGAPDEALVWGSSWLRLVEAFSHR